MDLRLLNHTVDEAILGGIIGLSDLLIIILNFVAVFSGVLLSFRLAERAKQKHRLIDRAVVPVHERAKAILESFNPDMLAEYSVSESRELEPFERKARMPTAPAIFYQPLEASERAFFLRACKEWPPLTKWDKIAEDGRAAYLSIFRAHQRLRRVLDSFVERARVPAALEGTDDWPLHLVKAEYNSLSMKEELDFDHDAFHLGIFHRDQGGSDICFNEIPALSCPKENAESIANELGREVAKMEIAGLVKEARSAAKRIRNGASDLFDVSLSIIR